MAPRSNDEFAGGHCVQLEYDCACAGARDGPRGEHVVSERVDNLVSALRALRLLTRRALTPVHAPTRGVCADTN